MCLHYKDNLNNKLKEEETLLVHYKQKTLNSRPWWEQLRQIERCLEQEEIVKNIKTKIESLLYKK